MSLELIKTKENGIAYLVHPAGSIFAGMKIRENPDEAFENAIKRGMKKPNDWCYMYSNKNRDYFKHYYTRNYISFPQVSLKERLYNLIKKKEMRTANLTLEYTNDNEPLALKEVESMLKNIDGIEEILFLEVIKSRRACRNSCGKELSEEQFDALEFNEEEAWFDDYDFTLFGQIKTNLSPKDLLTKCNDIGLSIDEKNKKIKKRKEI